MTESNLLEDDPVVDGRIAYLESQIEQLEEEANRMAGTLVVCTEEIERLRALATGLEERWLSARERANRFQSAIEDYLENDSQANWDAMAAAVEGAQG